MDNNNQILVLRDNAKNELLQIRTVEDGISYLNKLKAIDVWVKAEQKDAELQNMIAEQKLRTQRILGELIAEGQRKGTIASKETFNGNRFVECSQKEHSTFQEIGLSRKQSSTFKAIATIPEDDFEEFINEKKDAVKNAVSELTTTGAVRLARQLSKKDVDDHVARQTQIDEEKELKRIAKQINEGYLKEQRKFFVSLIKI
jgi:hypothetical protein